MKHRHYTDFKLREASWSFGMKRVGTYVVPPPASQTSIISPFANITCGLLAT
jgi:hypothetical protein